MLRYDTEQVLLEGLGLVGGLADVKKTESVGLLPTPVGKHWEAVHIKHASKVSLRQCDVAGRLLVAEGGQATVTHCTLHDGAADGLEVAVSEAFPSCMRSSLTEIDLCHACSCHAN
jgi:hypothetical protein